MHDEDLRLAVECLPERTRIAMLEGIDANTIIVGAYTDRRGGVCPMLAAHRHGGRTDLLAFAHAWDRFCGAKRPRTATERELYVLKAHLEASLYDAEQDDFEGVIAAHQATARDRGTPRSGGGYDRPIPRRILEEAAAVDLLGDGRLQLGVSRGSPETALRGSEAFGYVPPRRAGSPVTCCTTAPSRGAASELETPSQARAILPSALSSSGLRRSSGVMLLMMPSLRRMSRSVQIARHYWLQVGRPRKYKIIALQGGYHGGTIAMFDITVMCGKSPASWMT